MKTWYSEYGDVVKNVVKLVMLIVSVAAVAALVTLNVKAWVKAREEPQAGCILFSFSGQPWTLSRLEKMVKQHQLIAISVDDDLESFAVAKTSKQERVLLVLPLSSAKPKGVLLIKRYGIGDRRVEYEIGKISYYQLADERPLSKKLVDLVVDAPN